MEAVSDTPEDGSEVKGPAPVVNPTVRSSRKSVTGAAKNAPAKRAAAKTPAARKAAAKRPAAKKAAAKAPAAKKAAAKKVAAKSPAAKKAAAKAPVKSPKKAAAKKTAAKKAPAKKPAVTSPVAKVAAEEAPTQTKSTPTGRVETGRAKTGRAEGGSARAKDSGSPRMAMCASVTEEMINELLPFVVGAGMAIDPLETTVSLPGVGEVPVRLGLTVVNVRCELRSEDGGRVRVFVSADGEVSAGASVDGAVSPVPDGSGTISPDSNGSAPVGVTGMSIPAIPPAPIPVLGEALVSPFIEVRPNGVISLGLDLREAVLVALTTDQGAAIPEGVDAQVWPGIVAMFGLLLGGVGESLFAALGEHVGTTGLDLDPEVGTMLLDLGVKPGSARVSVSSGLLSIGLAASESVRGSALPVPIAGKRVGFGLASSVVDLLTHQLLFRAAGDLPLPFELDVTLSEQAVGGRVRNTRLLPETFPDLRTSLRTEVRTRLLRGQLELSVQAAWLELPKMLPSFVNQLSKRVGELASLAPLRVKFPAVVQVPLPDMDDTIGVQIDDLRVTTDGIGLVASLA
ncbi:MAG: hypothetical protein WBA45_06320 [Microthrixaceae bacterium]